MSKQITLVAVIVSVVGSLFLSGVVYGGFKQEFVDFKEEMKDIVMSLKSSDDALGSELKETNKQLQDLNKNISENNGYQKAIREEGERNGRSE